MKKLFVLLLLLLPISVFAYSDRVIVGGNPIGIEIHSNGVYITDFYKVNNKYIGKNAGFIKGDLITKINDNNVYSISDLNNIINKPGNYSFSIERNNKNKTISLNIQLEDGLLKTGLYVKDQINGIGTLSYIDPQSLVFASLGHEIVESSNNKPFNIESGYIYDASINYINKSTDGNIGEIHASFSNEIMGKVANNNINGIYGKYLGNINELNTLEVGRREDISKGEAYLRVDVDGEIKDYSINIISLNDSDTIKNIYFEITDHNLLEKSGGVVQGMSGTPIIQNNKIIGVVNYVIVDDANKGFGIYITNMLEEGDKLIN